MGASFHCILLMRTSWHQAKSFIGGDVRPLIKFLRKIHYWIVVTYLINGWISSYCVWLICISYEDPLLDCISYEDPPLDRIPDGDLLLAHAWVRGQRSDLDRSDLLKNWRPILRYGMLEGPCVQSVGRPHIGKCHLRGSKVLVYQEILVDQEQMEPNKKKLEKGPMHHCMDYTVHVHGCTTNFGFASNHEAYFFYFILCDVFCFILFGILYYLFRFA